MDNIRKSKRNQGEEPEYGGLLTSRQDRRPKVSSTPDGDEEERDPGNPTNSSCSGSEIRNERGTRSVSSTTTSRRTGKTMKSKNFKDAMMAEEELARIQDEKDELQLQQRKLERKERLLKMKLQYAKSQVDSKAMAIRRLKTVEKKMDRDEDYSKQYCEKIENYMIIKEDLPAQRFLWPGRDRNREPVVHQMEVMLFGASCSPSSAQYVKNVNALEFSEENPEAVKAIVKRHFMDDYLDSCNSEDEAIQRIKSIIEIHEKGGFIICNWISNSKQVLESIHEDLRAKEWKSMDFNSENRLERVLGLYWNPLTGCFSFKMNFPKVGKNIVCGLKIPTKREVLPLVMSIYDPLGMISNFTVKLKILLKKIWSSGIQWDGTISKELNAKWKKWMEMLLNVANIQIPRCYTSTNIVANRIGEILENSDVSQWRWIPTEENVTDEATRDTIPIEFKSESRWLKGPAFLILDEKGWPSSSRGWKGPAFLILDEKGRPSSSSGCQDSIWHFSQTGEQGLYHRLLQDG